MTATCARCEGCGQIATSDQGEPWTAWLDLPLKSAAAVVLGLVRPIPCPACGGSGDSEAADSVSNRRKLRPLPRRGPDARRAYLDEVSAAVAVKQPDGEWTIVPGTVETTEPESVDVDALDRRERYADAIRAAITTSPAAWSITSPPKSRMGPVVDAVTALADSETAQLLAEVSRLRAERDKLAATVQRVRTLLDSPYLVTYGDLRAALAGPAPDDAGARR